MIYLAIGAFGAGCVALTVWTLLGIYVARTGRQERRESVTPPEPDTDWVDALAWLVDRDNKEGQR